jgi:ribosomal protein S27E
MGIYDKWKKDMEKKIKTYTKEEMSKKEKIPAVIRRCPKCHKLTLEFDPETGKIKCTSCGFEVFIPQIK